MLKKLREAWSFLLTKLNALGSILLAYALLNPTAAVELLALLPPQFRTGAALAIPTLWFLLVQFAKAKAIKKAEVAAVKEAKA
jgi:hypothetical protein